jgi:ribosomal protein L11 methyltransferase
MMDRKVIIIEPGMAFGTGTHATTRGCLEFLEQVVPSSASGRITALDVGTGSGILAIALAKLGVAGVWAIDNDPVAVKAARVNIRRNHVQKVVKVVGLDMGKVKETFNIVVANLTAETLIALSGTLQEKVSAKGYLILSGVLGSKVEEVVSCFASRGLILVGEKRKGSWITLLLKMGSGYSASFVRG